LNYNVVHWVIADADTGPDRHLRREGAETAWQGWLFLLLLIYAKADQDNLTDAQKAQLKKHVNAIIDEFS
jgi:hypothetical protein